jgi:N-acetylglutamate synthase-like GNAT family acetyltransferase
MSAKIRRVRISDRDDVVEISRHIWEGNDYLPSVFEEWLKDSCRYFYGVEVAGHVVAVGSMRLIENGRTGWMEGLRVHPDHRGRGYANVLTKTLVRKAERLDIQRLRYTTGARNLASIKLAKTAGLAKIMEMAVFWHPSPRPLLRAENHPPIRKSSSKQAYDLLEASPSIVPKGILVFDWKALDVTHENLEQIGKTHELCVAKKKKKACSLSFGCVRREGEQAWWSFTVYAVEPSGFLSQLSHNIAQASARRLTGIACTFETKFEKTLDKVDFGPEERSGMHLILFEKQLRREE